MTTTKTEPVPEQFELYNLTNDPLERINLADPSYATRESTVIQKRLRRLLLRTMQTKKTDTNKRRCSRNAAL